jgi:hypothetical protein
MVSGTAQIPYKIAKAEHCSQIIQGGTVIGFIGGFTGAFIGAFNVLKGVALMGNDFRIFRRFILKPILAFSPMLTGIHLFSVGA